MKEVDVSVVIPCYNSERSIGEVVEKAAKELQKMGYSHEIILVNDHSKDNTFSEIIRLAEKCPFVKGIDLSKNFGQHNALMAGFHFVQGKYVIGMDDDLQTDPSQFSKLFGKMQEGYDLVYGAYSLQRESFFRKLGSRFNNLVLGRMIQQPKNIRTSSFWLAKSYIIKEAIKYEHSYANLRGLFFRSTSYIASVEIEHFERKYGKSNYTLKSLVKLWSHCINFSVAPLRSFLLLGGVASISGILGGLYLIIQKLMNKNMSLGWPSLMTTILVFSGIILIGIGLTGEYIGRTFMCINATPQYVIRSTLNVSEEIEGKKEKSVQKIMILGAGVYQLPLLQKAASLYKVILVAPEISEKFAQYANKVYFIDLREQEKIAEIARKEKIDGIITDQTDIPVRTVAYVAEKLGLPGISYDTACLFTDKGKMREKLIELGVSVLPHRNVRTKDGAKEAFRQLGSPVIIKPVDNQGSRGVYKITSEMELECYFELAVQASPSGEVVIEKYVQGREFVVEAMSFNYEYKELILGDTIYFDIQNAFAARNRIFPSSADSLLQKRVSELNKKIIQGFGLKQGISHSEYIMDGDDIYLIETAARGGGVFISSDLIGLGSGLDTERFLLDIALGKLQVMPEVGKKLCYCGYMAFYLPEGKVRSIAGVSEVTKLDCVHRNILDTITVGMEIGTIEDKTSRFAIIVSGSTREELQHNMEKIKKMLKIEVETSKGLKYPIWE